MLGVLHSEALKIFFNYHGNLSVSYFLRRVFGFSDQCTIRIRIVDQEENKLQNVYVAVFIWYPNEKSKVLGYGKTDESGEFKFTMSWSELIGEWIKHKKEGYSVEKTALIIHVYDVATNFTLTDTVPITISPRNPYQISKTIKIPKVRPSSPSILSINQPSDLVTPAVYVPIIEKSYIHTGRLTLAYVKTDSLSRAIVSYCLARGEKTSIRLVYGYSFSNKLYVSGTIYTYSHSDSYTPPHPGVATENSEAYISMIGTIKIEIIGYYWEDDRGLREDPDYYEIRIWAYDLIGDSLSNIKGEDPYWGEYSSYMIKHGMGKGFDAEDIAYTVWHFDFFVNYELTEIPISEIIYQYLLSLDYNWLDPLIPYVKIVMDHSYWQLSAAHFDIWGAEDFDIVANARYVDGQGICLVAIDLTSKYFGSDPIQPY